VCIDKPAGEGGVRLIKKEKELDGISNPLFETRNKCRNHRDAQRKYSTDNKEKGICPLFPLWKPQWTLWFLYSFGFLSYTQKKRKTSACANSRLAKNIQGSFKFG